MSRPRERVVTGVGVGWMLPLVDHADIWGKLHRHISGPKPEWFDDEIRKVASAFFCYAWGRERWPTAQVFRAKYARIPILVEELRTEIQDLVSQGDPRILRACNAIASEHHRRNPFSPIEAPVNDLFDQLGTIVGSLNEQVEQMPVKRERLPTGPDDSDTTYRRVNNVLVGGMIKVANKIELPVAASKDSSSPSIFVEFVKNVLMAYRTAFETAFASYDYEQARQRYIDQGLSQEEAEEYSVGEEAGYRFSIKTLGTHTQSYSATANMVSAALRGMHHLANSRGICIVVVHHVRKADADDPFYTVSGSTGLTGAADTTLILAKRPSEDGVVLYGRGRDLEEIEIGVEFDPESCRWRDLGDPAEAFASDTRAAIFAALRSGANTPKGIAETTGIEPENIRQTLGRMVRADDIRKAGRGKYELVKDPLSPCHNRHNGGY